VGGAGLQEAVETERTHGEIGDMAWGEANVDRQGMLWRDHAVLKIAMAEEERVAIGIVAPGRCRIAIEPVMVTAEDALGATITGGPAVRARARGERGAVAAEHEGLKIPQEPALHGGEHPAGEQQVFEAGEEFLGAGLVSGCQQLLGEAFGHGVRLRGITGVGGVPLGLLLLEMAPMAALALAAGLDAVGTRWGIGTVFQPVNKGVEGADSGRLEGREASHLCETWMGAQVMGPLWQTFVVEQEHEQEGPEDTDRVVGRPTAWAWGIECAEQGTRRVQIEPEEHECGLVPRLSRQRD